MNFIGIMIIFFQNNFLFNYKITKINDWKIKLQLNTEICFLDHDNLIKGNTKPIIKLNFQLTKYLKIKIKKLILKS